MLATPARATQTSCPPLTLLAESDQSPPSPHSLAPLLPQSPKEIPLLTRKLTSTRVGTDCVYRAREKVSCQQQRVLAVVLTTLSQSKVLPFGAKWENLV